MLCHLRMRLHLHLSLRYPLVIHREANDLVNLSEKLLLSDIISDAPHHLWVLQINYENSAILLLFHHK